MNRQVGLSCCLVLLAVMSMSSVDAWFLHSVAGITSDIVKSPLETLTLLAFKSFLAGQVNGRVTQYRQMMYNANRPYAAAAATAPQPQPQQRQQLTQDPTQYRQVQFASSSPTDQFYNVRARRSVARDATTNVNREDTVKPLDESVEEDRQQFLELAEKLDSNKCIPRFVCEVMAGESVTEKGQFEDLVEKVFGDEVPEIRGDQKLFSSVYHFAAFSGKRAAGNADYCRQLFPKCKASESEFRKIAGKIFTGVDEDNETTDDQLIEAISQIQ